MRLIDADALLEVARGHLSLFDSCPGQIGLTDKIRRDEIQNSIADILNAPTVEPASPWHRVEDGLPNKVGSYLVYAPTYTGGSSSAKECKAGVMFARWLKGGHWSIEVGYYRRPGCVTHWMPLPSPPVNKMFTK